MFFNKYFVLITEKKCKGQNKAKGHGCNIFVPVSLYNKSNRIYGLGLSCGCYGKWLTSTPEGKEKIQKATLKATKQRRDLKEAETQKKERKSLPYLIKNTVNAVHKNIKQRDKYKPCISCNTPWHKDFQAGHYYKAELYYTLKFDYDNIHGQCVKCNIRLEGNLNPYGINLPIRIGNDAFNELKEKAILDNQLNHKWDREALNDIKRQAQKYYNKLLNN